MSRPLKMKQGLELLVTHFILPFHRLGYPKGKKINLVTPYDQLNSFEHTVEHVIPVMFTMWAQ